MRDRWQLACACVPMLGGIVMVALLSRAPIEPIPAAVQTQKARATGGQVSDASERRWVGVVVAGNTAELAADADGYVAAVFVQNGTRVAAGDKLVQFDEAETSSAVGIANAELGQRKSELARAQAKAEAANAQLERLRAGAKWLSQQELDNAASQARLAEAELRAAGEGVGMARARVSQQRMRRARRVLSAPFSGTVASLDVDPGDSVVAGQVVLRILSDDRQVRFAFPPGELADPKVAITLHGTELAVDADVTALRPEIDPSAQLVFATAALPAGLPDAVRWIPGAPVDVARRATPQAEAR